MHELQIEEGEELEYVKVEEIIFKGKQNIKWGEVEEYLKRYMGNTFIVEEYNDVIHFNLISTDEYVESKYTKALRGALAKTKANIVQIIPELIKKAINRRWIQNKNEKHNMNAKNGWYRYDIYFAMPVKTENEDLIRWNNYRATMVVRINDKGLFFYDIMSIATPVLAQGGIMRKTTWRRSRHDIINIKKEARTPRE